MDDARGRDDLIGRVAFEAQLGGLFRNEKVERPELQAR
jgi:hypothetical protein